MLIQPWRGSMIWMAVPLRNGLKRGRLNAATRRPYLARPLRSPQIAYPIDRRGRRGALGADVAGGDLSGQPGEHRHRGPESARSSRGWKR